MNYNLIQLLILFFISISSYSQISSIACDSNILTKEALQLFDNYSPKIEKSNQLKVQYRRAICGDLNDDSLIDVIVEFGLGFENSNGILLKQAAIYLNNKNKMKVVSGFNPDYCLGILTIESGIVKVQEYETCANFADEVKVRQYLLINNKLVEKNNQTNY